MVAMEMCALGLPPPPPAAGSVPGWVRAPQLGSFRSPQAVCGVREAWPWPAATSWVSAHRVSSGLSEDKLAPVCGWRGGGRRKEKCCTCGVKWSCPWHLPERTVGSKKAGLGALPPGRFRSKKSAFVHFVKMNQTPSWSPGGTCLSCCGVFVAAVTFCLYELGGAGLAKGFHVLSSPEAHRTRGCPGPGGGDLGEAVRGNGNLP